jgi:hypothetical protein
MASDTEGEQGMLIEVGPENLAAITPVAKRYQKHKKARLAVLAKELADKEELKALVEEANLPPLEGGVIRFSCDGLEIELTPGKASLKVKDELPE